jgi:hypothetical protein
MKHEVEYLDGTKEVFEEDYPKSEFGIVTSTTQYPVLAAVEGLLNFAFRDGSSVFIPINTVKRVTTTKEDLEE